MKNLIVFVLLLVSSLMYGQGMVYTFSKIILDDQSYADTTRVFINNEKVCVLNSTFNYCDAIPDPTDYTMTETPLELLDVGRTVMIRQLRLNTDAVPYVMLWEDGNLRNISFTSFKGEPIYLMDFVSEHLIEETISSSRKGWIGLRTANKDLR